MNLTFKETLCKFVAMSFKSLVFISFLILVSLSSMSSVSITSQEEEIREKFLNEALLTTRKLKTSIQVLNSSIDSLQTTFSPEDVSYSVVAYNYRFNDSLDEHFVYMVDLYQGIDSTGFLDSYESLTTDQIRYRLVKCLDYVHNLRAIKTMIVKQLEIDAVRHYYLDQK